MKIFLERERTKLAKERTNRTRTKFCNKLAKNAGTNGTDANPGNISGLHSQKQHSQLTDQSATSSVFSVVRVPEVTAFVKCNIFESTML